MKVEAGKTYRTRRGVPVHITRVWTAQDGSLHYQADDATLIANPSCRWWFENGVYSVDGLPGHPFDLVCEVAAPAAPASPIPRAAEIQAVLAGRTVEWHCGTSWRVMHNAQETIHALLSFPERQWRVQPVAQLEAA